MGKASSTKKVARAARTGGGRTARGTGGSLVWPALIGVVVVLGVILIGISRSEISGASTPPRINRDHWHAAIGFYDCDHFLPNEAQFENSEGLHTHGDGLIHLHPFSAAVAGKNATLGKYFELAAIKYSSTAAVFGNTTLRDGAKCGSKKGVLQTLLNGKVVADPQAAAPDRRGADDRARARASGRARRREGGAVDGVSPRRFPRRLSRRPVCGRGPHLRRGARASRHRGGHRLRCPSCLCRRYL